MKKLIFLLGLISFAYTQQNVSIWQVNDSVTQFGVTKPIGTIVNNKQDGKFWILNEKAIATDSLKSLLKKQIPISDLSTLSLYPLSSNPTYKEGLIFYSDECQCLRYYVDNSEVSMDVGFENWIRAKNTTGDTIENGSVVYISGGQGKNTFISKANAKYDNCVIGVATNNLLNNEIGYVTTFGIVRDVNTNMWTDSTVLYLDTVDGKLTDKEFINDTLKRVRIGVVIYKHAVHGEIFVNVDNGTHLAYLHDVKNGTPTNGNLLVGNGTHWNTSSTIQVKDTVYVNKSTYITRSGTTNALQLDEGEWDDLAFPATTSKIGVNSKPDFDVTNIGLLFPDADTTELIYIVAQMPHSWEYGTVLIYKLYI